MDILRQGAATLGIELSEAQIQAFALYRRELAEWNTRFNLTSIEGDEAVQARHFLDSLTVAPVLRERGLETGRLIDIGSGAGFPGIPLKLVFPQVRVALIEATGKKARFLEHIVATLGLEDISIHACRAEELARDPAMRDAFDVATARGLASMSTLAELALPFCRKGGIIVAHKKGDIPAELDAAEHALLVLGGKLIEVRPVKTAGLDDGRALVIVEKAAPTPIAYPRRPGVPHKKPL